MLVTLYTYTQIDAAVLERLPRLRLVATRTAGYSHIDVEAASAQGVAVAIVPAAATQSVAEFTFGALIALQRRRLFEAQESTRGGQLGVPQLPRLRAGREDTRRRRPRDDRPARRRAREAFGMGCRLVAQRARASRASSDLDSRRAACGAPTSSPSTSRSPTRRATCSATSASRLLKPSAILVNTARGGIVDDEALRRRLEEGLLGGAVLDVLEREPPGKELDGSPARRTSSSRRTSPGTPTRRSRPPVRGDRPTTCSRSSPACSPQPRRRRVARRHERNRGGTMAQLDFALTGGNVMLCRTGGSSRSRRRQGRPDRVDHRSGARCRRDARRDRPHGACPG